MLLTSKTSMGLPIFTPDNEQVIGRLQNIVVEPRDGKILALVTNEGWIFKNPELIPRSEVLGITAEGVLVKSANSITSAAALPDIASMLKEKTNIIGASVVTDTGHKLGTVEDFLFETTTLYLAKIYVQPSLIALTKETRILPYSAVVEVAKNRLIVSANYIDNGGTYVAEPTVAE